MKPARNQTSFLSPQTTGREAYEPTVPLNSSVPEHEEQRLGTQHAAILEALRDGPKTNLELAILAQRFSARLNELKARHPWVKECVKPGVYLYRLIGE